MADNTPFTVKNGFKVGTVDVIDSAGSWTGPGTNITGFQGNQGLAGVAGDAGAPGVGGAPGAGGVAGFQGVAGATGPQGPQGNQGQWAFGVQGFQGPAPVGAQGNQGPVGAQGLRGPIGPTGATGVPGAQGRAGFQGNQGPVGAQGAQGVQGAQGNVGSQGFQGNQGAPGNQGPQGAQGNAGAAGFQGNPGPAGNQGGAGPTGRNGFQGRSGFQGVPGFQGNQGPVGAQGFQGNVGPTGNPGPAGFKGYTGSTPSYSYVVSGGVARDATNINNYYKTSGTNGGWDGQVYASTGYTSGAYVSFKRDNNLNYVMMGLNSDPASDASYSSIDYAWYPYYGGGVQIYENGAYIGEFFGTYDSSTRFLVTYDNSFIRYWINEVLYREVSVGAGITYYMDSSFYYVSGSSGFIDVGYGAFSNFPASGSQGPTGATGATGFQGVQGIFSSPGSPGYQGPVGPTGNPGPQGVQAPQGLPADPIGARGNQGPIGAPGNQGPQGATGSASAVAGVQGFQGTSGGGLAAGGFYVSQKAAYGESAFGTASAGFNTVPAGSLFATSTVTQNYSDERLKTNIAPIDNAVTKITALRGVEYNWNELGKEFGWQSKAREVGLIAQDVQKILPEAVEPFINVDGTDYFTLHYNKIIPLAVESIKEQQQQIFRIIDKMKNKNLFIQPIDSTKFNYRTEL
jgi:hypothetical protein